MKTFIVAAFYAQQVLTPADMIPSTPLPSPPTFVQPDMPPVIADIASIMDYRDDMMLQAIEGMSGVAISGAINGTNGLDNPDGNALFNAAHAIDNRQGKLSVDTVVMLAGVIGAKFAKNIGKVSAYCAAPKHIHSFSEVCAEFAQWRGTNALPDQPAPQTAIAPPLTFRP